ncbi:hypothetical protein Moror_5370 [Moniliophthora roreri MCA 2997]|uniref:Uncharacterized protein n=2 Tax=Moniliophthora roreri TaxID=221103 RepID=V2WNJ5_MONRO|nr:hypothetical protein Moror_5370 [Moniliophthora roreri MCA 2997]
MNDGAITLNSSLTPTNNGTITSNSGLTPMNGGTITSNSSLTPMNDSTITSNSSLTPLNSGAIISNNSLTSTNDTTATENDMSLFQTDSLPAILIATQKMIPNRSDYQWARDAFGILTTGEALVQQLVWQHILHQYFTLQGIYSFVNPDKYRLPANLQPNKFSQWFKEGRKPAFPSNIQSLGKFIESFWEWWNTLNPDWQERIEGRRMLRARNGEWKELRYSGQNGLILLMVGLRWWFMLEGKKRRSDNWNEMAQDILWVLESLVKWENEHSDSPVPTGKAPISVSVPLSKPISSKCPPPSSISCASKKAHQ